MPKILRDKKIQVTAATWQEIKRGVGIDDMLSYVILSIFFNHFHLVLLYNRWVLEHLSMVFEIFCNAFYLSHVILVFPKT